MRGRPVLLEPLDVLVYVSSPSEGLTEWRENVGFVSMGVDSRRSSIRVFYKEWPDNAMEQTV